MPLHIHVVVINIQHLLMVNPEWSCAWQVKSLVPVTSSLATCLGQRWKRDCTSPTFTPPPLVYLHFMFDTIYYVVVYSGVTRLLFHYYINIALITLTSMLGASNTHDIVLSWGVSCSKSSITQDSITIRMCDVVDFWRQTHTNRQTFNHNVKSLAMMGIVAARC